MAKKEALRRLYRSRTNVVLGGVCGGIGEYFGVDPTIVRLLWVLFALAGGSGVLAYIIAWVIIPEEPGGKATPKPAPVKVSHAWFGAFFILLGFLLLFEKYISFRAFWPFALILIGVALVIKGTVSE